MQPVAIHVTAHSQLYDSFINFGPYSRRVANLICSRQSLSPDRERATGKAGNGKRKREREREAETGKDHRWCTKCTCKQAGWKRIY